MTIQILAVGKLSKNYLKEGVADYSKRIRRHCKFEIVELPEQNSANSETQSKETALLLQKLSRQTTYSIALSPSAFAKEPYSSAQLAAQLQSLQNAGHSHFSFIIGGSEGLGPELLQTVNMQLSFSALTFPHQLFRLMLCEQIYRCLKINSGQVYHK